MLKPLAITVIGGLISSMVLSLIFTAGDSLLLASGKNARRAV